MTEILYGQRVANGYVQGGSKVLLSVACNPYECCDCSFQRCDIGLRLKLGDGTARRGGCATGMRPGESNVSIDEEETMLQNR